jgi:acetyl-CoA carboxylase biotin carboxyl carrier protein
MDIRTIKKLIELVKETGIAELEIREDKESVRINSGENSAISAKSDKKNLNLPQSKVAVSPAEKEKPNLSSAQDITKETSIAKPAGHIVNSPMVGTVYLAPSPTAKSFVQIGQIVKVGDVLCLIEAMKMFNRIEADKAGVIQACLVESGKPVEYGQGLFVIEP